MARSRSSVAIQKTDAFIYPGIYPFWMILRFSFCHPFDVGGPEIQLDSRLRRNDNKVNKKRAPQNHPIWV